VGSPSPLITRGLGTNSAIVTQGFGIVTAITAVIRSVGKVSRKITEKIVDVYAVTVMLVAINGNELIYPISSKSRGSIDREKEIAVSINNFAVSNVYKPTYKIVINMLKTVKGIK
jgi:hypothetical protein